MVTPQQKPRRSCLGTLLKGTLGCLAFFAGGLLVLVLFLPRVVARFAPGLIEDGFAEQYRGRLEVERVDLAWRSRQAVRGVVLSDPEGREVARARVAVPSLLDFLNGERLVVDVELEAELVADDDGVTNLERALTPRRERAASGSQASAGASGSLEGLGDLDLDLAVRARRVSWSDARTRALGTRVEVRDLALNAALRPGGALEVKAHAAVEGEAPGDVTLDARAAGPLRPDAAWPFGRVDATLAGRSLPFAMVDGLAGQRGRLVEALGSAVDVDLVLAGFDGASGDVSLSVRSDRAEVSAAGTFADGVLTSALDQPLRVTIQPPFALLSSLAAEHLSPDAEVLHGEPRGPWRLEVIGLALPIVPRDGESGRDFALRALAGARGHLTFEAPDRLDLQDDLTREHGLIVGVEAMSVNVTAEEGQPLSATVYAAIDTGLPGDLQLELATQPAVAVGGPGGGGFPLTAFDLQVRNLASGALDAVLGGEGCTSELLGDAFGLRVGFSGAGAIQGVGGIGPGHGDEGDVIVLVRAAQGVSVTLQGHVADGVLGIHDGGGLTAIVRPPVGWVERCIVRRFELPQELSFLPEEERPLRAHTKTLSVDVDGLWQDRNDPAALARRVTSELELDLGSWRWFGAEDGGARVSLVDGRGTLRIAPEAPLVLAVTGELEGEDGRGALALDVEVPDPRPALAGAVPERVEARLRASDEALAQLAGFAGAELEPDALRAALGEGFELALEVDLPDAGRGGMRVDLGGGSSALAIEGTLWRDADGVVLTQDDAGVSVTWRPATDALTRFVSPHLPTGNGLEPIGDAPFRAVISGLRFAPPPPDVPEADRTATLLSALALRLDVTSPDLAWRTAPGATPVRLAGIAASARVSPDAPAELDLAAEVAATPPGRVAVHARTLTPTGALAGAADLRALRVAFEVDASELPTGVLDAVARQQGLLVDLFGPRVELAASSDGVSLASGSFTAHATSPQGEVRFTGEVADGVVTSAAGEGLEARLPLSPLVSERIVGPLVPLAVRVTKPEGTPPAALAARNVVLPLDGDLARLDAVVELDLGDVVYELLPGLDAGFLRDVSKERLRHVPPIRIVIEKGVARYDELPIQVGDHAIPFVGRFGLVDHALRFDASVPLSALGKGLTEKLGEVERYVKPGTAIPVEVRGTLSRPKLGLGDGFVEDLLQGAGSNLLQDLLDKAKKKD